jgi:hypothetical protein
MRFIRFRTGTKATLKPATSNLVHCQARIGIGSTCTNPPLTGKRLCSFHASLVGPWGKPDKVFEKIDPGSGR